MMNDRVLVSIIVPVYNERRYLKPCIKSIVSQTYTDIEIILVDDGSDDGTSEDCDLLAASDGRMKVIHKKNKGLSDSRVTGFERASGKWIMFVDDDDIISDHMVELFLRYIDDDSVDIIAGKRHDFYDESEITEQKQIENSGKYSGFELLERFPEDRQKTIITPLWGKLYRREFLEKLYLRKYQSVCPTIFFEDVFVTPVLYLKADRIVLVDYCGYFHREVSTSISRSGKISSFYKEQVYSGDILLGILEEYKLDKYYKYQIAIYLNSIIRLWCLLEPYSQENKELASNILKNYKKYIGYYRRYVKTDYVEKAAVLGFGINQRITRFLMRKFYFKV